jgi:predicted esterase
MVQIDFSLKEAFSWEKFCASQKDQVRDWSLLPDSSRRFLEALNIPQIHPDCLSLSYTNTDAPLMGPLTTHDYHESTLDSLLTLWKQASPAILAMSELWLRWFAALLAPMGIAYLMWRLLSDYNSLNKKQNLHLFRIVVASKLALASAVVLATDMSYVYQYGAAYGVSLVLASAFLALLCSVLYKRASIFVFCLLMLGLTWHLTYRDGSFQFGGDDLPYNVPEGLYYDNINPLVQKLISHWPADTRTYSPETGATPWTPTGDARTGIPFLVNFWQEELTLHKVWATAPDQEAVRLEVSFPQSGHHVDQPIYLVLHGLSGGSQEEYIKDFVIRANAEDSTVVIMIARGLMDTPIRGWNVFHGARVSDVAASAEALRPALSEGQYLIGAGYSMGAIVLANYVARSGQGCALDAAMAVSGVLDGRYQAWNDRAKRLWQPMLTITLRDQFVLGKLGERYRQRLSKKQMLELMRATHISVSMIVYPVLSTITLRAPLTIYPYYSGC